MAGYLQTLERSERGCHQRGCRGRKPTQRPAPQSGGERSAASEPAAVKGCPRSGERRDERGTNEERRSTTAKRTYR